MSRAQKAIQMEGNKFSVTLHGTIQAYIHERFFWTSFGLWWSQVTQEEAVDGEKLRFHRKKHIASCRVHSVVFKHI